MAAAEATALPGAKDFLLYAQSKGVEVFYVTNRKMVGYDGTKKNLAELGFPYVDEKHLLLRTGSSDKQERRDIVNKDYEVVMLLGDNLNDFDSIYRGKSVAERASATDAQADLWGTKFIMMPKTPPMASGKARFTVATGAPRRRKKTPCARTTCGSGMVCRPQGRKFYNHDIAIELRPGRFENPAGAGFLEGRPAYRHAPRRGERGGFPPRHAGDRR